MIISAIAGIKIFVTGGIGGVHRGIFLNFLTKKILGAENSFDISADLIELG